MTDHNNLWLGHRLILPEAREKDTKRCADCRFFIEIQGKDENRFGCIQGIEKYGKLYKRVPEKIHLIEILREQGHEGLREILRRSSPEKQACGSFLPRLKAYKSSTTAHIGRSYEPYGFTQRSEKEKISCKDQDVKDNINSSSKARR